MRATNDVTTYEPDNSLKKGYFHVFRDIFSEIRRNRWLIYQLFKRDFTSLYKQSFVGVLWAIIIPIITVGTFVVLNQSGIFNIGDLSVPYALYAVLGMAFWQLFSAGLIANTNALALAGPMITQINFSKKSLVIASTGQALLSFIIQFGLALLLFVYYRVAPSATILLVPLFVVPLLMLTIGFGLIFSLLNGIIRDIANALALAMTFLLFLTPILYALPVSGAIAAVATHNPLYYLISVPRSLILTGTISDWRAYAISVLLSFAVFFFFLFVFDLTESRVAERV
jgi:lipopolysaccharide transport system permease protein